MRLSVIAQNKKVLGKKCQLVSFVNEILLEVFRKLGK